jgi:hypothetical protein
VYGFSIDAVAFLFVVWAIAFAAALSRALADANINGFSRLVGLACTAGFVAIGFTGLVCGDPGGAGFNRYLYLGAAALIGGLGKEQDQVRAYCLMKLGIKVRIEAEESK